MRNTNFLKTVCMAMISISLPITTLAAECEMTSIPNASGLTKVFHSEKGTPAVYFNYDMDVNTDGAQRSYHPDDPRGNSKALNNIANAITSIYDANGKNINCSPRQGACFSRFISVFEEARDAGWSRSGHRYFKTTNIIPWKTDEKTGRLVPCLINEGPNKGYFVSMTALPADASLKDCNPKKWLDAMTINAIVIPGGAKWKSQGIVADSADIVVVRNRKTGKLAYAIIGDTGPADALGEGTIALAATLGEVNLTGNETYQDIKKLALNDVDYLILPTYDIVRKRPGAITQDKIQELGAEAFAAWGGIERLNACKNI